MSLNSDVIVRLHVSLGRPITATVNSQVYQTIIDTFALFLLLESNKLFSLKTRAIINNVAM